MGIPDTLVSSFFLIVWVIDLKYKSLLTGTRGNGVTLREWYYGSERNSPYWAHTIGTTRSNCIVQKENAYLTCGDNLLCLGGNSGKSSEKSLSSWRLRPFNTNQCTALGLCIYRKQADVRFRIYSSCFYVSEADTELYLSGKQLDCLRVSLAPAPGPQGNILEASALHSGWLVPRTESSLCFRQVIQQKSHNIPKFPLKIVLCSGVYASFEWCGTVSRDWAQKDGCSNPRHNNTVRKTRGHSSLALGCSPSMEVISHVYGDKWKRCHCMPIGEVKTKWPKQRILVKIENFHFVSLTWHWFPRWKWDGSDLNVFPRRLAYRRHCKVIRATDFVTNQSGWHNWLDQGWYPRLS